MSERQAKELDDDYYLANFHTIAGFVVSTYRDLMSDDELEWFESICSLPEPAQRLYIRLLTRRGSTFRVHRLHYLEIEDIAGAAEELTRNRLASDLPPQDWSVLLGCFTKPQLLDLLDLSGQRSASRVDLTRHITQCEQERQIRYREVLQASDQWISLAGHAHWMLLQLCFFGNLYQDSSELVRRQLGTLTYADYPLDRSARAFTSREQIDAHWRYFECEALFDCVDQRDATALLALADALPDSHTCANDVSLRRRLDRIRNRIARQLERLSCADEALALYELSVHPPARERRVRILMDRKLCKAALNLATQMSEASCSEAERLTGLKLVVRCKRSMGIAQNKNRLFKPASSKLVLRNNGARVEEIARRFFSSKGVCFHTENTLVNGVLGLFIWDIIFYPVPGVFFNPFQMAPADFNEPEFSERRADLLKKRFAELDDSVALGARVHHAYSMYFGRVNPLVRWHRLSPEMLALAIDRIPPDHWRALFNRILSDTRENTSGFPDLVLFTEAQGYEFIEIKGPGDTLQANQRRWMQHFDQHGIPCRLVNISYRSDEPALDDSDEAIP